MKKPIITRLSLFVLLLFPLFQLRADDRLDVFLSESQRLWLDSYGVISVGFDAQYPPYSFLNENQQLEGFVVDVFQLIEAQLGVEFDIVSELRWADLYQRAQRGDIDVVANIVPRADRKEWFLFGKPYIEKPLVVMTRAEDSEIRIRDDLKNKRVALVRGYQYIRTVLDEYPSVEPHYVDDILGALTAVSVGDADAAITYFGAGHYYRNKHLLGNLKYAVLFDKSSSPESMAVSKSNPELLAVLEQALQAIPEATMLALREKWLPSDYDDVLIDLELTKKEREWLQQHSTIRLGVDPEFAPFEFIQDEQYRGMVSDYIELLNQRLNIKMEVVEGLTWDEAVEGAKRREIDILPAVGLTAERQQFLNYTQPYLSFYRVIVTRESGPFVLGVDDLDGLSVAVQSNSSHHGYVLENTPILPRTYPTLKDSLLAVSAGEVDAFIGNVAATSYWIRQLNLNNLKIAAPVSNELKYLHFAVRNDWPELVGILNKGLDSITDQQRKEIARRWLTIEYEPTLDYLLIVQIVAVFIFIFFIILAWTVVLKRQVRKRTEELEYYATYDDLTDLPNRFLIIDRLSQAIQKAANTPRKIALLSTDIVDFKRINDVYGHDIGDLALHELASRLKRFQSKDMDCGRVGGNQFLLIYTSLGKESEAAMLAERLCKLLAEPVNIDGHVVRLHIRVGIAVYPNDGCDAKTLAKYADSAAHSARKDKQAGYGFYTEELREKVSRHLDIEQQLQCAIENSELKVFYQPKVETKTRKVVSFEALLRWHSPLLGDVSPVEFIPVAERSGLINEIGLRVIKQALSDLVTWQGKGARDLAMAINLSPVQLRSEQFMPQLKEILSASGLNPSQVIFEITEGVLLEDDQQILKCLDELRTLGVRLAMDDFGTGYSSLSYLRKYHFDIIKIDREFITHLASDESSVKLVAATIAMAHTLGISVVAEGVEQEEQRKLLSELECDVLQGWLFGKAEPFDVAELLLNKQPL